jgi:hypothetical protein
MTSLAQGKRLIRAMPTPDVGRLAGKANESRKWGQPRPCALARHERILWQGIPDWRSVAVRVFHIRAVAAYFAVLTLIDIGIIRNAEGPGYSALKAGVPTAVTGLVCIGILAFLAFAIGRTTRYTLTTRRIIMQFGVALPATLMLPLHQVVQCDVAIRAGHDGDIALRLSPGAAIPYVKLWPHARPWRLRTPMPMLRDLPRAAIVATRITHALIACAEAKRAAERDQALLSRRQITPVPADAAGLVAAAE